MPRISNRALIVLGALAALVVASSLATHELAGLLRFELRPSNEDLVHRTLMAVAVAYALLLSIPFVPGAEVGVALMVVLGPPVALLVYLCTVAGLSLAFLVGRLVPMETLARALEGVHLVRMSAVLREVAPLDMDQRMALLLHRAPNRLVKVLLRHRYLALAVALNLPGNLLLGGGGGIAMVAGVCRLHSVPGFVASVAIAVMPVPLAVALFGTGVLGA